MDIYKSPFEPTGTETDSIELFKEYFWNSSETCNNCFQRVRAVGERHKVQLEEPTEKLLAEGGGHPLTLEVYDHFSRTEHGSQEHTTWDTNKRFGTCFCLDCGTDCTANHRHATLDEMKPLAGNIYRYTKEHTPLELDPNRFGREIADLKTGSDARNHQGYETEILAISFSRAIV